MIVIDRSTFTVVTSDDRITFPKSRYRWEVLNGGALHVVQNGRDMRDDDQFHVWAPGQWTHLQEGI